MTDQKPPFNLSRLTPVHARTIVIVTICLILVVVAAAVLVFGRFSATIRETAAENLQVLADSKREQIEGVIAERTSDIAFIAGLEPVWRLLDPATHEQQRDEFRRRYLTFATNL